MKRKKLGQHSPRGAEEIRTRDKDLEDPPVYIPKVIFGPDGEPMVAREMIFRASPVPRSIAIILIIMAGLTLAQGVYFSMQQSKTQARNNRHLAEQVATNGALAQSAASAAAKADRLSKEVKADQAALTALVGKILTAKTPAAAEAALKKFLEEARQRGIPAPAPSAVSSGHPETRQSSNSTSRSGNSRPSSRPTQTQPSSQPSSRPSPQPSPSPTPLVCATVLNRQACVPRITSVQNVEALRHGLLEQQRTAALPRPERTQPLNRAALLTIALLLQGAVLCEHVHHRRARS